MKSLKSYIHSDIPIHINGSRKTSKDLMMEHIRESYGQTPEVISPHPLSDDFDNYLNNYQEHLDKIIGKHRYSTHQLDHDELISEANLALLKKRDEILSNFEGEFNEVNFRKLAYTFVRNIIKWTHYRIINTSYVSRRDNSEYYTEDGFKTSWEFAIDKNGEEDAYYENFDRTTKCEYLLKMVKEYSGILTDGEIKVLSFLEKGLTQYEIAEKLGVTHQAISCASVSIFDKIKAHFSSSVIKDNSFDSVSKGHKAIKDFFTKEDKNTPMEDQDKPVLKKFLLENAKAYTASQISEKFMRGKYNNQQIASFAVKNKISFCLIKSRASNNSKYKFSEAENEELLHLFKNKVSVENIAELMNIPKHSVSGKRGHFVKLGLLEHLRIRKPKNETLDKP